MLNASERTTDLKMLPVSLRASALAMTPPCSLQNLVTVGSSTEGLSRALDTGATLMPRPTSLNRLVRSRKAPRGRAAWRNRGNFADGRKYLKRSGREVAFNEKFTQSPFNAIRVFSYQRKLRRLTREPYTRATS